MRLQWLLAAAQAARKAILYAGRVDTVFKVGDRVLLRTKELLDTAEIGKLRGLCPRRNCPFTATACPSPNAYTSCALQRKMLQPDSQCRVPRVLFRTGRRAAPVRPRI